MNILLFVLKIFILTSLLKNFYKQMYIPQYIYTYRLLTIPSLKEMFYFIVI